MKAELSTSKSSYALITICSLSIFFHFPVPREPQHSPWELRASAFFSGKAAQNQTKNVFPRHAASYAELHLTLPPGEDKKGKLRTNVAAKWLKKKIPTRFECSIWADCTSEQSSGSLWAPHVWTGWPTSAKSERVLKNTRPSFFVKKKKLWKEAAVPWKCPYQSISKEEWTTTLEHQKFAA